MKVGKRLTAFFLAGMLILTSNVTGFAKETTADQQPAFCLQIKKREMKFLMSWQQKQEP